MTVSEKVESDLIGRGMIREGHFVLAKGGHTRRFFNVKGLPRELLYDYCYQFARELRGYEIDVVIGPESGGTIPAELTAFHVGNDYGRAVPGLSVPKDHEGKLYIRPQDIPLLAGSRVCITEDVATSGNTVVQTDTLVRSYGGTVSVVCVVVNRGGPRVTQHTLGVSKLVSLYTPSEPIWSEDECRALHLCKQGVPIDQELGRGREYVARKEAERRALEC